MVVRKLKRSVTVANADFGTVHFELPAGAKITHFIVEADYKLNADSEFVVYALDNNEPAQIGDPDFAGRIMYDKKWCFRSTSGAGFHSTRHEYNLHDEEVKNKNGIFGCVHNSSGDSIVFVFRCRYKVK